MANENRITRITTWITVFLLLLIVLILPTGYFFITYQYTVGSLSLYPLIIRTAIVALFGFFVVGAIYLVLRAFPIRALIRVEEELRKCTSELTMANKQLTEEISARKTAEERILHNALHDALTGFPNRTFLMARLTHAFAIAKRRKDYFFALLFMELDRFEDINNSLGHIVGDQLLIALSQRLRLCLRPNDTIARIERNEFAFLLEDIGRVDNAIFIAKRIEDKLAMPFDLAGHEVTITSSIGIALSSTDYGNPDQILRDADTALHQAKLRGGAKHVVFEQGMHTKAVTRLQLEIDLRKAIERKEIVAFYQPILSLKDNSVVGFEALARWQHPKKGFISPGDFIPVAEDTGIITSVDRSVLRDACIRMRAWQSKFPESLLRHISVNISNKHLSQPDLVEQIKQILDETGLGPKNLNLEITETSIMEQKEAIVDKLSQLRDLGIQIYIDDFGTGYSSLSRLHNLPIDGVKIDRSFVMRMDEKGEGLSIIKIIVMLAQEMKVDVVAEGIETKDQLAKIGSLECEKWQGFLFSKPVDSEQAEPLIMTKPQLYGKA